MELYSYQNGNCSISLMEDGTKERSWPDGQDPNPAFPESIDCKITNACEMGCEFCHESSVPDGTHCSVEKFKEVFKKYALPSGAEIAIGGGNIMLHPEIEHILRHLRDIDLVPNITLRAEQVQRSYKKLCALKRAGLYFGLGISNPNNSYIWSDSPIMDNNVVYHYVVGVDEPPLHGVENKILILGYKRFGFGLNFYNPDVERNIKMWEFFLPRILTLQIPHGYHQTPIVSFDNLSLEQLRVKKRVSEELWRERFMGDDGQFTMYYDAVEDRFAVSSTSRRIPRDGRTIQVMFDHIRF